MGLYVKKKGRLRDIGRCTKHKDRKRVKHVRKWGDIRDEET